MLRYIWRTLLVQWPQTLLSVLAVAAAIVLVLVLEGFNVGLYQQVRAYPDQLPVPLVATQSGVRNITAARSVIPLQAMWQAQGVEGVEAVHPLVGLPLIFERAGQKTPIYLIAYHDVGGPWKMAQGRRNREPGELVMDERLAREQGLSVGDQVSLWGLELELVGLSAGTDSMFNPYLFVGLEDALKLFQRLAPEAMQSRGPAVSFLLVEVTEGAGVAEVRQRLEDRIPEIDLFTPKELADNDVAMTESLMGGVMGLLVGVAYLVGVLVIGLTLYAAVMERTKELGVVRALGAGHLHLVATVMVQALVFTAGGLVIGLAGAKGVAVLLNGVVADMRVVPLAGPVVLRSGLAAVAMALVASLFPLYRVLRVDPMQVFRGG